VPRPTICLNSIIELTGRIRTMFCHPAITQRFWRRWEAGERGSGGDEEQDARGAGRDETAILPGQRFGTSAEFWCTLQTMHEMEEARRHMHRAA
jgi:hypothetical protein